MLAGELHMTGLALLFGIEQTDVMSAMTASISLTAVYTKTSPRHQPFSAYIVATFDGH